MTGNRERKILVIVGNYREFLKLVPVIKVLCSSEYMNPSILYTGSKCDKLDYFCEIFNLKIDYNLGLISPNQYLDDISAQLIESIREILIQESPNLVLLQGDTATTFCAAYAAFLAKISVAHIGSGLRIYHRPAAFPARLNCQLIAKLVDIHFASTNWNQANLISEGIDPKNIFVVGNPSIDTLYQVLQLPYEIPEEIEKLLQESKRFLFVIIQRDDNLRNLESIFTSLNEIIKQDLETSILVIAPKNPNIRAHIYQYLDRSDHIHLLDPVEYQTFCYLLKRAYLVLTDKSSLQEEALALGIPIILVSDFSERPEGCASGGVVASGVSKEKIANQTLLLLQDKQRYNEMKLAINPYGDGQSSQRIIRVLKNALI